MSTPTPAQPVGHESPLYARRSLLFAVLRDHGSMTRPRLYETLEGPGGTYATLTPGCSWNATASDLNALRLAGRVTLLGDLWMAIPDDGGEAPR